MTSTNSAQGTISYLNQIKSNLIHESTIALTRSAAPQRSRWRWRWCSWAARATWLRRERSRSSRSGRGATGGGPSDRSRTLVRLGGLPSPSVSRDCPDLAIECSALANVNVGQVFALCVSTAQVVSQSRHCLPIFLPLT